MFGRSHSSIKDHPKQAAGVAAGGALLGATAAMLLTPRRGSEVRHSLGWRGRVAADKAKHLAHWEKEMTKRTAHRAKSLAESATGRAKDTAAKVKDDTLEMGREAKTAAKETKDETTDMVDHVRKHGEP